MIESPYYAKKWFNLDELIVARDKCLLVVRKREEIPYSRYASTAEKFIPMYDEMIAAKRAAGKKTVAETLKEITGNDFVVLRSI
jgi:hypothetical protein